jgi:hypothetical protein
MTSIAQLPRIHGVVELLNPLRHFLIANFRLNVLHQLSELLLRIMAASQHQRLKSFEQFGAPFQPFLALA